jgi:hypothetical protein
VKKWIEVMTGKATAISDNAGLIAAFTRMVAALSKIGTAKAVHQNAVKEADAALEKASKKHKDVIEELEPMARNYCITNRKKLIPEGRKSVVIGPVRVEFKFGTVGIRAKNGDKIPKADLLLRIDAAKETASAADVKILDGCINRKPTVDKKKLVELPAELLDKMDLTPYQEEEFYWKPNAER